MSDLVNPDASDKRRTWGLILLAGGGIAMTAFASVVLWLVRENADYAFYLGLCAMALIGIVLTGFAGLLMKRTIRANILGNEVEISDQQEQQQ